MLEIIKSLFNRSTDPLSNPKTAANWVKRVKLAEINTQLEKVQEAVQQFATAKTPVGLHNLQALLLLDQAIQPSYEMICQQYILNPRISKPIEERIWTQIVGFSRVLVAAYQRFIQLQTKEPQEAAAIERLLPVSLARSLRYVGIEARWHYFRFEKPESKLWTTANQLYRISEVSGVDSNPFSLYPELRTPTTSCADEYLQIMMLATLNNGNFTIRQFDWADRWLDTWSRYLHLERKYQEGVHQFCVNLQEGTGPLKINGPVPGDLIRYWGVSELLAELDKLLRRLEHGESPQTVGLGEDVRMPGCLEFIRQLEILWSRERSNQIERSERHRVSRMVDVVHGFSGICQAVRQDNDRAAAANVTPDTAVDSNEIMDIRMYGYVTEQTKLKQAQARAKQSAYAPKPVEHDSWVIENESTGGFGAVLPTEGNDWVRLGVIVALRQEQEGNWLIGVIRRLNRQNQEQLYAGVQVLSQTPVAISLRGQDDERTPSMSLVGGIDTIGATLSRIGLYVPYQADGRRANTMIIQAADYALDKIYQVHGRDKVFTVRVADVLEKGVDWVWAQVEVVRRSD